jgi:hypothetical protein
MDRRSFFTLAGALGLAPLAGCEGRDEPPPGDPFAPALEAFRAYVVPDGIEPHLVFQPLRQPKR